jgi:hypothetical protein
MLSARHRTFNLRRIGIKCGNMLPCSLASSKTPFLYPNIFLFSSSKAITFFRKGEGGGHLKNNSLEAKGSMSKHVDNVQILSIYVYQTFSFVRIDLSSKSEFFAKECVHCNSSSSSFAINHQCNLQPPINQE